MPIQIITADQRLQTKPKVNIALFAPSGVGKTFQARTLDNEKTLFIDLEAGTLALNGSDPEGKDAWQGDVINIREQATQLGVHPWELARALVCLLGGPNPAAAPGTPYAQDQFAIYEQAIGPRTMFEKYDTVFIDSITVASRLAFAWSKTRPEAFSEKTGKPDNRGAYGLLGQEVVTWLTEAQHIPGKSIVVVGILDTTTNDFGQKEFSPQIEGGKTGKELPGIFDQVLTLGLFDLASGSPVLDYAKGTERGFICHLNNGYGVPAKDRSGRLEALEAPNLGELMKKIQSGPRIDKAVYAPPSEAPPAPSAEAFGNPQPQPEPAAQ